MKLFKHLPDEIFRPLASSSRAFYAELLLYLNDGIFGTHGETPKKAEVLDEIGRFIEENAERSAAFEEDVEISDKEARESDPRRYQAYQRLVTTGWLAEYKDRYRRLVDFDPDARLLLQMLASLAKDDVRSYGGRVLNVLTSLKSAVADPENHSESLRNAAVYAGDFMQHLRTIGGAMRKVEEAFLAKADRVEYFDFFFRDFVEEHLIRDYKTLHTNINPFRYRHDILVQVDEMAANEALLRQLEAGYVREARARDPLEARAVLMRELAQVRSVFRNIDPHLDIIDDARTRIERRMVNTVRYLDRISSHSVEKISRTIEALGALGLPNDAVIPVDTALTFDEPGLNMESLQMPRQPRRPVGRQAMRPVERDQAAIEFDAARRAYRERILVTPAKVNAYLARALKGQRTKAAELPLESLDDFLVFRRLRFLEDIFDGRYREVFAVERPGGQFVSEWLVCPDFVICLRETKDKAA